MSDDKKQVKNVHQRMVDVMHIMGAVGKGGQTSYGERFQYHKIDDIDDPLRKALVECGLTVVPVDFKVSSLEHFIEKDRNGKDRTVYCTECILTLRITNADDPNDHIDIVGWGHGLDYSDKSTGKATSYAAKAAYLSAFHLRGQPDNEEDCITRGGGGNQQKQQPSNGNTRPQGNGQSTGNGQAKPEKKILRQRPTDMTDAADCFQEQIAQAENTGQLNDVRDRIAAACSEKKDEFNENSVAYLRGLLQDAYKAHNRETAA